MADRPESNSPPDLMVKNRETSLELVRIHTALSFSGDIATMAIRKALGKQPLPCKKGCHHCCYEPVEATVKEALLAASMLTADGAISETQREAIKANIVDHIEWFKSVDYSHSGDEYRAAKKLCPFCIDGECIIYDGRPVACRTYFTVNGPEVCRPERTEHIGEVLIPMEATYPAWIAMGRDDTLTDFMLAVAYCMGLAEVTAQDCIDHPFSPVMRDIERDIHTMVEQDVPFAKSQMSVLRMIRAATSPEVMEQAQKIYDKGNEPVLSVEEGGNVVVRDTNETGDGPGRN